MVHELLGLNDNRVVLKGAPGVRKDLEEVSFSPRIEALPEYTEGQARCGRRCSATAKGGN